MTNQFSIVSSDTPTITLTYYNLSTGTNNDVVINGYYPIIVGSLAGALVLVVAISGLFIMRARRTSAISKPPKATIVLNSDTADINTVNPANSSDLRHNSRRSLVSDLFANHGMSFQPSGRDIAANPLSAESVKISSSFRAVGIQRVRKP